jgi:DNA-binding CsgD family transcriptional regulator
MAPSWTRNRAPAQASALSAPKELTSLNSPNYSPPVRELPGASRSRGPLLERGFALEAIADAIERARAGRGSAILVQGRHGLGKSHLLASAKTLARQEGLRVLSGAGLELEQDFDYGVVLQLFDPALKYASDEERSELLTGPAQDAGAVISPGRRLGRRPAKDSFRTLRGLYWLAANLAESRPMMLAVDDADLADARSFRFFVYLLEHLDSIRAVVLLSHGAGLRTADSDLMRKLAHHPAATHLRLEPLSETATTHLVRLLLPGADGAACRAAYAATRGNPSLIEALAEDVAEPSPTSAEIAAAAPRTVAERILHRVGALGAHAATVVSAAAILGDDAELRHVARLAGLEPSGAGVLVDDLIAGGVLADDNLITFSEPMLRRAVEATLPPARRADLHLRAADLLGADGASPRRLADHLVEALPASNEWVVDVLSDAAAEAMAKGAPRAATTYMRRALEEPPPADRRPRATMALGRAEATAGDPAAVDHLLGAMDATSDNRERAEIALDAGLALLGIGRQVDAAGAFRRGLHELDDAADPLLGRLTAAYESTRYLWPVPDEPESPEPVREAGLNPAPDDRAVLAQAALEAALRGDPRQQVIDLAARALDQGVLLRDETADGLAYYLACEALTIAEELGMAEVALSAAVQEGLDRGSVPGTATAHFFRSTAFLRRGAVREAAADAQRALDAESHGWRFASAAARVVRAEALIAFGSNAGARRCLVAAEAAMGDSVFAHIAVAAARAHLAGVRGKPDEALAGFVDCGRLLEQAHATNPAVLPWRSGAARALAALGDREEARAMLRLELERAEAFGAPGVIGRGLRALGAIEGGKLGLEALEAAVKHLEKSQAALERARALVDFGAALRRSGQRRAAREPLLRGMELARRFGAEALARRAMAETKAAGARPRRTALKGRNALTAREEQVATLAAEGRSNREIANELVITRKTVEWHLKHVFRKLGLTSRSELGEALGADSGSRES